MILSPVKWLLLHYSIDTVLCMLVLYFYTVAWNLLTYTVGVMYSYDKKKLSLQYCAHNMHWKTFVKEMNGVAYQSSIPCARLM